jgi:hypothetical protein
MTTLLFLLAVVIAAAAGLSAVLWRLLRSSAALPDPVPAAQDFAIGRSRLDAYRPMNRLFSKEDFAFATAYSGAGAGLSKRLRRQRSRILRLYLQDLRRDFSRLYAFCRLLAPKSPDPQFASLVTQQALTFYGLWLVLQLRCSLGWFLYVRVDTADLVGSLERLREAAKATMDALTPQTTPQTTLAAGTA